MKAQYFPGVDANGNKLRDFACSVLLSDNFPGSTGQKWKWGMVVHGRGERSDGRQSHLEQLAVKGFDWNNDGNPDSYFISDDMKKAIDLHQTIIVVPTYANFFEPDIINRIYDFMLASFNTQSTFFFEGFSLGGQAVFKYISSSEANARRVHLAVPVAAPYGLTGATGVVIAAKYGPVVHAFSYDKDNVVSSSNTVKQVNDINGQGPAIKAQYTLFRKDNDHGGDKEALALTPPVAPGGQGVIDAAETIWQLNDAIVSVARRQLKTGTVIVPGPVVIDPPAPPITLLQPVLEHKVIGNTVYLDGSKSTGMKSAKLAAVAVPNGVNIHTTSIEGGGSAVGKITLTTPGVYKFRLTIYPEVSYKGTPAEADVEVTIGTAQPEPFKATHTMITEDGIKKQIRLEEL